MQLLVKLTHLLPLQTGKGKNGEWKKQDIIVETDDQYPKKICVSIWGDKINEGQLKIGNILKIDFDTESKEYKGKWYSDIKAWKIEVIRTGTQTNSGNAVNSEDVIPDSEDDILPF